MFGLCAPNDVYARCASVVGAPKRTKTATNAATASTPSVGRTARRSVAGTVTRRSAARNAQAPIAATAASTTTATARRCPWLEAAAAEASSRVNASERAASTTAAAGAGAMNASPASSCSAARVDEKGDEQADRERNPAAAPEGEVERRDEYDERDAAANPPKQAVTAEREAGREQRPDRRERTERVPVPDRVAQAVAGDGIEGPEALGEEPRRQRVRTDDSDCREQSEQQAGNHAPAHGDHCEQRSPDVDEVALGFERCVRRRNRPRVRCDRPRKQGGEAADERHLERRQPDIRGHRESGRRSRKQREAGPAPRRREVAALNGRDRDDQTDDAKAGEKRIAPARNAVACAQDCSPAPRRADGRDDAGAHPRIAASSRSSAGRLASRRSA